MASGRHHSSTFWGGGTGSGGTSEAGGLPAWACLFGASVGEEARLIEHPGEPTYVSGSFIAELVRYPSSAISAVRPSSSRCPEGAYAFALASSGFRLRPTLNHERVGSS